MTNTTWEKEQSTSSVQVKSGLNIKYVIAGLALLAGIVYLILTGTASGARYYVTVKEVLEGKYAGQTVRVTGAVIGSTIQYDAKNLIIDFSVAHVPQDTQDLAYELYLASNDPNALSMKVHIENQVKPDLLQHEAQAILTGVLGDDGVFYASELLLKCPSRYGEVGGADALSKIDESSK
ncbi:MAG: hypothetical protein OHK0023_21600 [Anaerolineae bacterium]